MHILYHVIVAYLTLHLLVYLFHEKRGVWQISTALVLILFLLRCFLIK
jgi:hypothetical protein